MAKVKPTSQAELELESMSHVFCRGEMIADADFESIKAIIPLNPLATDDRIKDLKGDDPADFIFKIAYRANRMDWEYEDSAYQDIANTVNTSPVFVMSSYGHQDEDAIRWEGRPIYGSVIGALLDTTNGFMYFRIIPDAGDKAKDVKRWVRNKQINAVSIWGFPTTIFKNGKVHVIAYRLLSVDFVPPLTEGQKNVAIIGEMDKSFEQQRSDLQAALREKYPDYAWVEETYPDHIIANYEGKYFLIPYSGSDTGITLGDALEVRRVVTYESIPKEDVVMEAKDLSNDALLAELKTRTSDGRIPPAKVAGEMSIAMEKPEQVAAVAELAKIKAAAGEMDPLAAIEAGNQAKANAGALAKKTALGEMVKTVKTEKGVLNSDGTPAGEMDKWVEKLARFEVGMTREQVSGEMDRIINDADVKAAVASKSAQPKASASSTPAAGEIPVVEI